MIIDLKHKYILLFKLCFLTGFHYFPNYLKGMPPLYYFDLKNRYFDVYRDDFNQIINENRNNTEFKLLINDYLIEIQRSNFLNNEIQMEKFYSKKEYLDSG
jgi:hypothetical protein